MKIFPVYTSPQKDNMIECIIENIFWLEILIDLTSAFVSNSQILHVQRLTFHCPTSSDPQCDVHGGKFAKFSSDRQFIPQKYHILKKKYREAASIDTSILPFSSRG